MYVCTHLLDRQDISSISRMMCSMRRRYPDGSGIPPLNENKLLHEFVRMYQVIDFYRFESKLVKEFLQVLKPYERGEKVYLYASGKRNEHLFVGRVFSADNGNRIRRPRRLRDLG